MIILNPTETLDSSNIVLGNPTPVQGGSYFTKLKNGGEPLYIQMPKCLTKKGLIKTEKTHYCDLMYERGDGEELIEWIENLEICCQDLINKKKHVWFHTELTADDIATMMSPICRIFRSGKNILIRVNIDRNKHDGQQKCIAYNEHETLVELDSLAPEQKIIPLISIDGIKFTARSFEICITMRQLMILDREKDLETNNRCLISLDNPTGPNTLSTTPEPMQNLENNVTLGKSSTDTSIIKTINEDTMDNLKEVVHKESECENEDIKGNIVASAQPDDEDKNADCIKDDIDGLKEVNLELVAGNDTMQLKSQSEVYYEIYKDAKEKAKQMRAGALKAYLEAEKIKMKFSLDNVDDESDFDDSYSECSEDSEQSSNSVNLSKNLEEN